MAILMSFNAKLYRGTAGAVASTEVTTVGDAALNIDANEATIADRSSIFEFTEIAQRKVEVTCKINADDADAHLAAFNTSYETAAPNNKISLKVLDKASGKGVSGDFIVTSRKRSEGLKEQVIYDFTFKPCKSAANPCVFV